MVNDHVWSMIMEDQWSCMINDHIWSLIMHDQWSCMIRHVPLLGSTFLCFSLTEKLLEGSLEMECLYNIASRPPSRLKASKSHRGLQVASRPPTRLEASKSPRGPPSRLKASKSPRGLQVVSRPPRIFEAYKNQRNAWYIHQNYKKMQKTKGKPKKPK